MNTNPNIISYGIYLPILTLVIIHVGKQCCASGKVWMLDLFDDPKFITALNNLLLIAYYLLNIGYVVYAMSEWPTIYTTRQLLEVLAQRSAHIILLLACLHYFNILAITVYAAFVNRRTKTKPT